MSKSLSSRQTLALAALLAMSTSASAAEYSIEPIYSPVEGGLVLPSSISSDGMVVGHLSFAGWDRCFKYQDGVSAMLPFPIEQYRSCVGAVTDAQGNITMTLVPLDNPATTRLVELSTKGGFRSLVGLTTDGNKVAASKSGRMAGTSLSPNGEPQAYLFTRKGAGVNVGALTGMTRSWLTGLNAKSWAVGHAQHAGGDSRLQAFRYRDGKLLWLGNLIDVGTSRAEGINASGTIVGTSATVLNDFMSDRAVTWQGKAAPVNLGTFVNRFTRGAAINSDGVIVGNYSGGGSLEAMRVRDGVMEPLTDLIDPQQKSQWTRIGKAIAINDNGLIVGGESSYNSKFGIAYLLRPLP